MFKIIISTVFTFHIFISCGFTPSLKMIDGNEKSNNVYYEIVNSSLEARESLRNYFKNINKNEAQYITYVQITEDESAVNIASNGSVLEYKVEVLIKYKIIDKDIGNVIHESQSRSFANYDVSTSEYNNNLVRNEALKTAITEAAQLMNIMVESKISE